ncbi:ABC transporter, ATP-binding protein (cluster 2, ribose/xylose/arabinose/galactose) / ABC transporter, ATP-binding protein (cluster 2, ribose/xylose/arabinose/galactose) [Olavius sp. associated proteobacterium Delta 1]|nr:ABC transporter, ATP-binding protein (cluster 2, ribose/xylose/arabinose/galactose) / ABC transporter, ATP-binding protein (cluster 2, ribose/xylose/arabinose/galactose) [Olavius sp. associated proteobacterium Delta 1]
MPPSAFLHLKGITKNFDGTQALKEVDFMAEAGEVHAIVGENGAGKSTLMKILAGALQPDVGVLLLEGKSIQPKSPQYAFRLGIRTVYQEFSLAPHLSVTENILLGQMPTGRFKWWVDWQQAYGRANELLESIGFKGVNVRSTISSLSVSHQQMVEIAKAVAQKPRILILDEPSAVLSQDELKQLFALIHRLKQESTLVLYISHRLDEVFEIADRITVLKDGETVGTVLPSATSENQLIKMMVGRPLEAIYPQRKKLPGKSILDVNSLNKVDIFSDVSFTVADGEILGMFGLVGSGRTEVARCIFAADTPDSGTIKIDSRTVHLKSPCDAVRTNMAMLTEDRKRDGLVMQCSICDNAGLATMRLVSRWSYLLRGQQKKLVQSKVQELSIRPADISRKVRELSGGNQQKVVLAKWLLSNAKLIILDEPTRGVDVATKVEIYHLIGELADAGAAIILISSELPEILGLSDRILVMREGRLAGEFDGVQADEESLLACAAGINV